MCTFRGGARGSAWRGIMGVALLATAFSATSAFVAPSQSPPGGLQQDQVPQFVLFTHDDAITDATHSLMLELLGSRTLSGCQAAATMFVTTNSANVCNHTLDLHGRGFEIGDHTRSHPSLKGLRAASLRDEVLGAQEDLVSCGVPEQDIAGLRAPFLESDAALRGLLAGNGFQYDSSLIEEGTGNSLSGGMAARVWPFQSDEGIPINCDWFSSTQECSATERLPGFWQVPVWQLIGDDVPFSMDYGDDDVSTYTVLKQSFDATYGGNRAPFPVFGHTPWLTDRKDDVVRFLDEISDSERYPGVFLVTVRQLLAWMENPVPLDKLTPQALGCGSPGGAPGNATGGGDAPAGGSPAPTPAPAPARGPRGNRSDAGSNSGNPLAQEVQLDAAPAGEQAASGGGGGNTAAPSNARDALAALGFKVDRRLML